MNIEEVFPAVFDVVAADPLCAAIPRISQEDPDYDAKFEAALRATDPAIPGDGPGVAFVLWAADGLPASGNTGPLLDLENGLMLSVVERRKTNQTGASAIKWVRRLLRLLHRKTVAGDRSGRLLIRHPARSPAYSLGPLDQGLVIYFVHLEVRSIEPIGALPA